MSAFLFYNLDEILRGLSLEACINPYPDILTWYGELPFDCEIYENCYLSAIICGGIILIVFASGDRAWIWESGDEILNFNSLLRVFSSSIDNGGENDIIL
jgi:hypothetical protein